MKIDIYCKTVIILSAMGNYISVKITPEGLHGLRQEEKTVVIKTEAEEEEEDDESGNCCCCSKFFACLFSIL